MNTSSQPSQPPHRTIHGHTLYSAQLQESRTIKVVVPAGDAPQGPYPVIYCHDGGEFLTHGRMATLAAKLMADGELRPIIIVAMHVNKAERTSDYAPEGKRNEAYCRFVVEECLPFIEGTYPVSREADKRFLAGVSLGGAASMTLHLNYPQLFSQLLLFSGAFYQAALDQIRPVPFLDDLALWMLIGTDETAVDTTSGVFDFLSLNRQARDLLYARGADVDYKEAPGSHLWGFWQQHLPDALRWVERRLSSQFGQPI